MHNSWKRIHDFIFDRLWDIDLSALGWLKRALIRFSRIIYVVSKELSSGQLTLRAMSLVYTTLLSLVPLLAVSFSVLKAFGVHNQIEPLLQNFLTPLGPKGAEITARIIGFVENVKVGVLGAIGLALLIYTVISLIQKVESAFNYVWRIKRSRSFVQKFSNYLSVILVGPVLVFSAMGITATIMNTSVVQALVSVEPMGSVIYLAGKIIPYLLVCAAFTFIYVFIPNTKVRFGAALAGGLIAGILWESIGWLFASFIVTSTKYTAIYSGFAILIMFMIWLYLSWMILLIGAVVSYHQQYPNYMEARRGNLSISNRLKERLALMIMYLVGDSHYHNRKPWTLESLVSRLRIPVEQVQYILSILEGGRLVIATGDMPPSYLPARDVEKISLEDLYHTVRTAEEKTYILDSQSISIPDIEKIAGIVDRSIGKGLKNASLKNIITSHEKGSPQLRASRKSKNN